MTTNQNIQWMQQGGAAMLLATGLPAELAEMLASERAESLRDPHLRWLQQGGAAMLLATGVPANLEKVLIGSDAAAGLPVGR
ncbi:hypothetical protein OHV05_18855 [Kitasatospora sp. NBC_00070]|uniref:hypothetical protein n=1 Tax=Kitasatospora sp. NBC_00070 TaxID=2975962 RepID=UPI0032518D22